MELYVAWWNGDPRYHFYDKNCNLLIDVSQLSSIWDFNKSKKYTRPWFINDKLILPKKIMVKTDIDKHKNIEESLLRQIKLVNGYNFDKILFIHPDVRVESIDDNNFDLNLKSARDYIHFFNKYKKKYDFLNQVLTIGVVHGTNLDQLHECATKMINMGYGGIALGNRESISKFDRTKIATEIKSLKSLKSTYLHILGVSSFDLFKRNNDLTDIIDSIDSSTPISEGKDNGIYFSSNMSPKNGVVRFKVCSERMWPPIRSQPWINQYGFAGMVCNPLFKTNCNDICKIKANNNIDRIIHYDQFDCNCPTCKKHGVEEGLLRLGKKIYNNRRGIHNYYHIKSELTNLVKLDNPFVDRGNSFLVP